MKAANDNAKGSDVPSSRLCPVCGKPAEIAFKPFCSRRCADVDLHRWLGGHYAIPAREPSDADDDAEHE